MEEPKNTYIELDDSQGEPTKPQGNDDRDLSSHSTETSSDRQSIEMSEPEVELESSSGEPVDASCAKQETAADENEDENEDEDEDEDAALQSWLEGPLLTSDNAVALSTIDQCAIRHALDALDKYALVQYASSLQKQADLAAKLAHAQTGEGPDDELRLALRQAQSQVMANAQAVRSLMRAPRATQSASSGLSAAGTTSPSTRQDAPQVRVAQGGGPDAGGGNAIDELRATTTRVAAGAALGTMMSSIVFGGVAAGTEGDLQLQMSLACLVTGGLWWLLVFYLCCCAGRRIEPRGVGPAAHP